MWRRIAVFGYEVICKTKNEGYEYVSIHLNKKEVYNFSQRNFTELPEWMVEKIINCIDVFL
ncbi:hypothetical protein [Paenibacillus gallinarum]|uniref:Uncharacterized protein n=1 Tax=Paenibacillus gallinarum TaxID=2762232 RepID=A0ABR8SWC3_9BACL|nr:hypothetical protein [Paenibacillus gallinarum]MBD7967790.1 hypothetical protein [Paenibacillus gallinarum]